MRKKSRARAACFALALAAAAPALGVSGARDASASVSVEVSLHELVAMSASIVVATPLERRSAWEDVEGGHRIVTHTRLRVERAIAGEAPAEAWVRTLGGVVGKVGQAVPGEASLAIGQTALLFLMPADGTLVVAARSQGHFPVVADEAGAARLRSSAGASLLLPRRGPSIGARDVLVGETVDEAAESIRRALADAKRP